MLRRFVKQAVEKEREGQRNKQEEEIDRYLASSSDSEEDRRYREWLLKLLVYWFVNTSIRLLFWTSELQSGAYLQTVKNCSIIRNCTISLKKDWEALSSAACLKIWFYEL